jgi:hypothetical protein
MTTLAGIRVKNRLAEYNRNKTPSRESTPASTSSPRVLPSVQETLRPKSVSDWFRSTGDTIDKLATELILLEQSAPANPPEHLNTKEIFASLTDLIERVDKLAGRYGLHRYKPTADTSQSSVLATASAIDTRLTLPTSTPPNPAGDAPALPRDPLRPVMPRLPASSAGRDMANSQPSTHRPRGKKIILHVGKSPTTLLRFKPEGSLTKAQRDLNAALQAEKFKIQCREVKLTRRNNLLLSFPSSASHDQMTLAKKLIFRVLALSPATRFTFDVHWSYIQLANVPTRSSADASPYSVLELQKEVQSNPALRNLAFTRLPSWVIRPDLIKKSRSSISFAFEDHSGKLHDKILGSEVFLFGSLVQVKPWHASPPPRPKPSLSSSAMDTRAD